MRRSICRKLYRRVISKAFSAGEFGIFEDFRGNPPGIGSEKSDNIGGRSQQKEKLRGCEIYLEISQMWKDNHEDEKDSKIMIVCNGIDWKVGSLFVI